MYLHRKHPTPRKKAGNFIGNTRVPLDLHITLVVHAEGPDSADVIVLHQAVNRCGIRKGIQLRMRKQISCDRVHNRNLVIQVRREVVLRVI